MGPLDAFLTAAIGAGVGMVQLRDKNLANGELLETARHCARVCRSAGVPFIINDRVDVAVMTRADGVHLGQDDLPVAAVRKFAGPDFIIGLSTHTPEQVDAANGLDVDYIGVGPIWETPTKPGRPPVGLKLVQYAAANANPPFFAIGGVDESTIGQVIESGARRVSVLRWITQAEDPAAAVQALLAQFPKFAPEKTRQ